MTQNEVPIWCKYTLSIEEAAEYFRIGQHRLRQLVADNPTADYILQNGNRTQIKRKLFEQFVDSATVI
ncbi:excisionase [Lachnospiraceae bacterium 45-W7]